MGPLQNRATSASGRFLTPADPRQVVHPDRTLVSLKAATGRREVVGASYTLGAGLDYLICSRIKSRLTEISYLVIRTVQGIRNLSRPSL